MSEGNCFSGEESEFCLAEPPIEMTPEDWQIFASRVTNTVLFLVNDGFKILDLAYEDPEGNFSNALNSARCAFTAVGDGWWYFIAAAYHFMRYFEYEQELVNYMVEWQPLICTCEAEAMALGEAYGIAGFDFAALAEAEEEGEDNIKGPNLLQMGICSEEAAVKDLQVKLEASARRRDDQTD